MTPQTEDKALNCCHDKIPNMEKGKERHFSIKHKNIEKYNNKPSTHTDTQQQLLLKDNNWRKQKETDSEPEAYLWLEKVEQVTEGQERERERSVAAYKSPTKVWEAKHLKS